MIKVVHIQKDVLSAGRAALRLHNAMVASNIDSNILSLYSDINDTERMTATGKSSRIIARIDLNLEKLITRNLHQQYGMYSFPVLGTKIAGKELIRRADVIYVHWVQRGFLNFPAFRQLAKLGKPVIVVMHDMWPITGGCHHSFTCEKYKTKCFDCQMFPNNTIIDWPTWEFNKKKKLYSGFDNFYFVSPSKWLYDCAKQSFLTFDKPVFHIPNIIDTKVFKPIGRNIARKILNIEERETVVAFGAFSLSSAYKGWSELIKALRLLSENGLYKDLTVLIFGGGYNRIIEESVPFRTRFMGFLKDEYSTALLYNAIDILVTPSVADNLPTAVLESQACGTPVVAFDVGGLPDIIVHKKNGYLARYRDSEDLANGIQFCLENKIKGHLLPEFNDDKIIAKHLDLINRVQRGIQS